MTVGWLSVLVVPTQVVDKASKASAIERAGAQLVLGRLSQFDALADAEGRTQIRGLAAWQPDSPDGQILRALGLMASGQAVDLNALRVLASNAEFSLDARGVLAVLAGIGWSDAGQPSTGLPEMLGVATAAGAGPLRGFLSIHMAQRLQESGDEGYALQLNGTVRGDLQPTRTRLARTLDAIARRNEFSLSWAVDRRVLQGTPSSYGIESLAWTDAIAGEGLTQYVDEAFKSFFDNPYTRTVSFGAESQVDGGLRRALFQAELLGDHSACFQFRKLLGRYRLLTRAGQPGLGSLSGFALLRRAGDHEALARSLTVFRAAGPLEVLRAFGNDTVARPWLPTELQADLTTVAAAGIALDATTAGRAFDRLLESLPAILNRRVGGAFLARPAFDGLAAIAPHLDEHRLTRMSAELRAIADGPPDPIVHQSMAGVLHALPWEDLGKAERDRWLRFMRARLAGQDDRLFPARVVAAELLDIERARTKRALIAAFRRTASLWLGELLIHAGPLPRDVATRLREAAIASAEGLQARAHQGQFGMGGTPVGGLLGNVVAQDPRRASRNYFVAFVSDPVVPIDERVAALQALLDRPEAFPKWVRTRLGQGVPASTSTMLLLGDPSDLAIANLRLRARFGSLTATEALALTLTFSTSPETQARAVMAQVVDELAVALPEPHIATILLSLARDQVPVVRGYAGRSLAILRFTEPVLEAARRGRVSELLREGGEIVPGLTWQGVLIARRRGDPPGEDVRRLASAVATNHLAASVREAAALVLKA